MLPSEALAIGSKLLKPWKGALWNVDGGGNECGCALACIFRGYGAKFGKEQDLALWTSSFDLDDKDYDAWVETYVCPAESCKEPHWTASMVTHLNDDHDWSREAIGKWLISLGL